MKLIIPSLTNGEPISLERALMEYHWSNGGLRSGIHIVGWTMMVTDKGQDLVACKFTMSDASKAMRKRFTDMRRRFINSLYRGKYARI